MTRPLVLLHGFTGSPESWTEVRRALRDHPDPLAPALLGHDGSVGPTGIHDFEAEVDRLAAVIQEEGRAGAHVVGYSMGGRVALALLVRHPGLFSAATLIGASPGLSDPAERQARSERDEEWARLLERAGLDTFVAAWQALPLFEAQTRLPAEVVERQRRIRSAHDPRGLARSLRVAGLSRMPDYRPDLEGIEVPVRLVVGGRDAKFRALAAEMAERLARPSLTVVPGTGHNVVLERPAEIAGLLREDRTE